MSVYGMTHEMKPWMNKRRTQLPGIDSLVLDMKTKTQSTIAASNTRAATPVSGGIVV
jgi:hypothetical protein